MALEASVMANLQHLSQLEVYLWMYFKAVTPRPEYSLFSLFWLGQGVTWVMYVFFVLSRGFIGFWGCLLSRCFYTVCLWLPTLVLN